MKQKLVNKTVLITGHLSEISKTCALAAIKEGANVIIADMRSHETEMAMEEIKNENSNVFFISCDPANYNDVQIVVREVVNNFGSIDVALNNTGINCEINAQGQLSKTDWLKIISLNLNGLFNCMTHQLPEMAKQKSGVILNMASVRDENFSTSSHYIATKHGIIGLTKTAALEYAAHGIRINALCPGSISTPIDETERLFFKSRSRQKHTVNLETIKKRGKAKEIANGFVFLASEKNPFMTGTAVEIEGGYLSQ